MSEEEEAEEDKAEEDGAEGAAEGATEEDNAEEVIEEEKQRRQHWVVKAISTCGGKHATKNSLQLNQSNPRSQLKRKNNEQLKKMGR